MLFLNSSVHRIVQFFQKFRKLERNLTLRIKLQRSHGFCTAKIHGPKNGPWNVLFFGTDDFSVESLKTLHNEYRNRALQRLEVVTVNNSRKANAVTQYAKQHGIIINTWPICIDLSLFDIGIVVSFGHLIPSDVIKAFPLGMLNVHASLLPRWRGASPIIYSLMNGDLQTGVTIMKIMPKKFDIGEIFLQRHIDVSPHETLPELHTRLAKLGADLLKETVDNLPQILQSAKPQDTINVTYAPKISPKISLIKWNDMTAKNVYDLQRALLSIYPLTTRFESIKIKLFDIEEIEKPSISTDYQHDTPGVVIFDKKNNVLLVKCKEDSWICVKKLIIPGRPAMKARDFYNGFLSGRKKKKTIFF